ncbi:preprotein translocase subunit YajC [Bacillus sp. 165]|uniref:preprotein translocase subunit YajC n=1 Tax=Bacillus sp. 165 TaxID=1529117 RepID=UPI001ADA132E|nr:preprotein translocase subunit YajC [Bacillus sp. 165]MBO9130478.1 preprotein translocase subunit YajC [Bacillus sp. 165]
MNGILMNVLPLVAMFAIFYFLLIRPQQRRQKEVVAMQNNLKKGDQVITIGGLHGIVDSVTDATVVVKAGNGSHLTFERNAIREVKKA